MSAKAELKYSLALFSIAIGALAVMVAVGTAVAALRTDAAGWFGCTAVSGLLGLLQIRKGVRLRNKALAEGATLLEDESGGTGHTTRSGTAKPSFLDKRKKPD